ncbi:hypothetical protein ASD62_03790 [Phycicoccus sp. Root563]|nr:hypothetical protein ASD62_03790 [Phycicoccus sp. Root563]
MLSQVTRYWPFVSSVLLLAGSSIQFVLAARHSAVTERDELASAEFRNEKRRVKLREQWNAWGWSALMVGTAIGTVLAWP